MIGLLNELRSRREERGGNGVKNLKRSKDIPKIPLDEESPHSVRLENEPYI